MIPSMQGSRRIFLLLTRTRRLPQLPGAACMHAHTHARGSNTVIILTGATATGKSSAAEFLCTQHAHDNVRRYEIVVADSVQAMRYLNIGANKPSEEVMAEIPHHMVNIHEPGVLYSAGEYCRDAKSVVVDILKRGNVPLIVGGNTMWVDWLIKGVPNAPKVNKEVKLQAAKILAPFMETVSGMDSEQTATDSNISAKWAEATIEVEGRKQALLRSGRLDDSVRSCIEMTIASNDWYRLHRLLEIIITLQLQYGPGHETDTEGVTHVIEQRTDSEKHVRFQGLVHEVKAAIGIEIDLRCFFLGGDRVSLYKAIDKRCVAMLSAGLFDEIVDLFNRRHIYQLPQHTSGYANQSKEVTSTPPSPTASAAIGYRQTVNYLCREKFMEGDFRALLDYIDQFSKVTRNYAKRQMHWYRKDANFLWIHDTSNNNNDKSAQRVAEEIYHWTYMVSRSEYETSLNAQFVNAKEFASSEEMKEFRNKTHLLKAKFKRSTLRSGESYILRSCEGALDRSALKRYTSDMILSESQLTALCATADLCRSKLNLK